VALVALTATDILALVAMVVMAPLVGMVAPAMGRTAVTVAMLARTPLAQEVGAGCPGPLEALVTFSEASGALLAVDTVALVVAACTAAGAAPATTLVLAAWVVATEVVSEAALCTEASTATR